MDANTVSFAEDGTFSINASKEQLAANTGLRVLSLIAGSSKRIGLTVGNNVAKQNGSIPLTLMFPIQNLSTTADPRGNKQTLPPNGFDGIVGIFSSMAETRLENVGTKKNPVIGTRPANLGAIAFHELTENFFKTNSGLQYQPAHDLAIGAERALRRERPELESFAFGAGPFVARIP